MMHDSLASPNCTERKNIAIKGIGASRGRKRRKQFGDDRGELGIIARIESLRAGGLGFDRIADRLNDDGVPSRSGKAWHGIVINRILARRAQQIDPRWKSAGLVSNEKVYRL